MKIALLAGKITSKGPAAPGDVVDLPEAEAREFLRRGWATETTAKPKAAEVKPDPEKMSAPVAENREETVAKKTAKRGRPKKAAK